MPIFGEPVPSSGNPAPAGTDTGATGVPGTPEPSTTAPGTPVQGAPTDTPTQGVEKQYVDTSQLGDHLVKVRVDGADVELPLKDALNGVMMQQAFTRRTQELANERKRLAQLENLGNLLESDPRGTLQQLATAYELDLASMTPDAQADPMEQRFATLENQLRQQSAAAAQMQIKGEIEQLKTQFGDFDEHAVIDYAARNRLPVTTAYRDLNFDRLLQQQQRSQQGAQNRTNALAAQVVEGGQAVQPGAVGGSQPQINSVRDAWNAAKRQHGIT